MTASETAKTVRAGGARGAVAVVALVAATALLGSGCERTPANPSPSQPGVRGSGGQSPSTGVMDLSQVAAAAALPTDHPVGRAVFAYAAGNQAWLVTQDGRRYALEANALAGRTTSISPDGRWLLHDGRLRDLTGTTDRALPPAPIIVWSPNGEWMLLDHLGLLPAGPGYQVLVNTETGRATNVSSSGIAVLDDGTVLVGEGGAEEVDPGDPKVVVLRIVDPATGTQRRQVTIDTRAVLPGEEAVKGRLGIIYLWLGPQEQVLFTVGGSANPQHSALLASLADSKGLVLLPVRDHNGQFWRPIGFLGSDVLLRSHQVWTGAGASASTNQDPVLLSVWHDGRLTPRFRLPSGSWVLANGARAAS